MSRYQRCMTFADCRPQTADRRLQTADHRLQTADCRLQTADCRPQAADCSLQIFLCKVTLASFPKCCWLFFTDPLSSHPALLIALILYSSLIIVN